MDNTRTTDLPFVIKVCGITCIEDAQGALDAGANALGFNFYGKSPRFIRAQAAAEITRAIRARYLRVGVFVNASSREMESVAELVGLDVFQLHGECETPSGRVWRSIAGEFASVQQDGHAEAYLLDAVTPGYGGSGTTFNWTRALGFPHRAIVAGGLDASNVADAIAALRPWGVDACSRLECAPGKKDAARVREFVKAAQAAMLQEVL
jgi:phosphoribosylanthranilate isomerase